MLTATILLLGLFRSDNDAQTNSRDVFLLSYLTLCLLSHLLLLSSNYRDHNIRHNTIVFINYTWQHTIYKDDQEHNERIGKKSRSQYLFAYVTLKMRIRSGDLCVYLLCR